MNKVLTTAKNIVLAVFACIYNLIPCILSIFALLIFEIFDSNIFTRVYAFLIFAIVLLIILVVQLVFIFRTDKISQIIVASTFLIDFVLYLTLTVYIYQKPNTILDDFISSKFVDKDFIGFTSFFQTKHKCCAYGSGLSHVLLNCSAEPPNPPSCTAKLHQSYNDNKPAFRGVSLFFTLLLIIIIGVCIFWLVWEYMHNKESVSNESEDISDINEKSKDENDENSKNDPENPENSEDPENSKHSHASTSNQKKNNNTVIVDSKPSKPAKTKKNNSYVPLSNEVSESEANKKLEQEIFFGKPKYDPYEADPYEN